MLMNIEKTMLRSFELLCLKITRSIIAVTTKVRIRHFY